MTWVRLDDQFPNHPKVDKAGPAAAWLHVCALCHSSATLTDGFISTERLPRLADLKQAEKLARRLVDAGMWVAVEGGWQIHDYLDFQPSAAKVLEQRAQAAARKSKSRNKSREESQRDIDVTANETRGSAALSPSPKPVPADTQPSSSPPTVAGKPDDDAWIRSLALEFAQSKLASQQAAGQVIGSPHAWLKSVAASERENLVERLRALTASHPEWSRLQLHAALTGDRKYLQELCGECDRGAVVTDAGVEACTACAIPEGVTA